MAGLAEVALACFEAGLKAADPERAVARALKVDPGLLEAEGALICVAIGKASPAMMRAVMGARRPERAFLVTNYENAVDIAGCDCHAAGHPTPDANGAAATAALERLLAEANAGDKVLVLLSGGGSALLPAPISGVSLADKIALNDLMVRSGIPIGEMNAVRRRFSNLKGGGLARLAAPVAVTALILSDVPGDDLAAVASGPTVASPDDDGKVHDILTGAGLWEALPASIRRGCDRPRAYQPVANADNRIIGSNAVSVRAMAAGVPEGFVCRVSAEPLVGDVRAAAGAVVALMREAAASGPAVLLFGGETTVRVTGGGLGGRNQELCMHVARALAGAPLPVDWAFLSAGTDGRDGPTDAAGGVVTQATMARLAGSALDVAAEMADNNSNALLKAADALLVTGATGTNVADLQVAVLAG